jgi:TATA-box binding protein (TBP) (component of TFIID and TFIIIB)
MSDSITKYYELVEKETSSLQSEHQKSVKNIVEILQASKKAKLRGALLKQVVKISQEGPHLTPGTVFQIAADIVKVDELCNK